MDTEKIDINTYNKPDFYIGLFLAVSSSVFIGSSLIVKKISLLRLNREGSLRAGAGGFRYLKDWIWWTGFLLMGFGELLNFVAYAFAPASLVTPLGALSVLVSNILATRFLKERMTDMGKLGCFLCIMGSTIIVIYAPKEEHIENIGELLTKVQEAAFIEYLFFVSALTMAIILCIGPKFGTKFVIVYITVCSAIGSLTVMACKGLGIAIKDGLSDSAPDHARELTFMIVLFLSVIVCICVQMNYLNKALDLFSTTVVIPVYYVMFTTLVIVISAILFKEWENMSHMHIFGVSCGFATTVVAIYLLNAHKEQKLIKTDDF